MLDYKRRTHHQQHYVVSGGVRSVQEMLLQGLDVRLGVELTSVSPHDTGVDIQYRAPDGRMESEQFDLIVLAVSPDIAASLFPRLNKPLSSIPTTTVETVAHTDESSIRPICKQQPRRRILPLRPALPSAYTFSPPISPLNPSTSNQTPSW